MCKPTDLKPRTEVRWVDILHEACLQVQIFLIVTERPKDIGDKMVTNQNIDIVAATGEVPLGKMVAKKAG